MDKRTTITVAAIVAALVIIGLVLSQKNAAVPAPPTAQAPTQATTLTEPKAENVFTIPSSTETPGGAPDTEVTPDVPQQPVDVPEAPQTDADRPPTGTRNAGMPAGDDTMVNAGANVDTNPPLPPEEPEPNPEATITYTANGYEPTSLKVKKGTAVTWLNRSSSPMWTASASHPTHTVYPTTGGCLGSTFDACLGVATDQAWSFTFDIVGSWNYHDHLKPSNRGTVIVEE